MCHEAVPAGTAAHPAGCARLSAFHRGSHQGAFAPFAQLQARLPGTRSQDALAGRALPVPPCPSPENAPPAPAVVPASVMPEAARERIANPHAGTALAPSSGLPPEAVPYVSEFVMFVTEKVTNVKSCLQNGDGRPPDAKAPPTPATDQGGVNHSFTMCPIWPPDDLNFAEYWPFVSPAGRGGSTNGLTRGFWGCLVRAKSLSSRVSR